MEENIPINQYLANPLNLTVKNTRRYIILLYMPKACLTDCYALI